MSYAYVEHHRRSVSSLSVWEHGTHQVRTQGKSGVSLAQVNIQYDHTYLGRT